MPILPMKLVRKGFNGFLVLVLTRDSERDVPDDVRVFHHQREGGNNGEEAYE